MLRWFIHNTIVALVFYVMFIVISGFRGAAGCRILPLVGKSHLRHVILPFYLFIYLFKLEIL